jgi:hypothetical protein
VLSESPPAQLLRTHPLLLKSAAVALGKFHPLLKAAPRPMHTLGMERQRHDVKAFAAQCAQHLSASAAAHLGGGGGGGALPEAPALLPGALALFLTALQQPVATEAAAKGLKSVCAGAPSEVRANAHAHEMCSSDCESHSFVYVVFCLFILPYGVFA